MIRRGVLMHIDIPLAGIRLRKSFQKTWPSGHCSDGCSLSVQRWSIPCFGVPSQQFSLISRVIKPTVFSIWQKHRVATLKLLNLKRVCWHVNFWKRHTCWSPPTRECRWVFLATGAGIKETLETESQTLRFVCFASVLHVLLCKFRYFFHQRFGGMPIKETCTICCVPWASFRRSVDENVGKTLIRRMNRCEFATVMKMPGCCLLHSYST